MCSRCDAIFLKVRNLTSLHDSSTDPLAKALFIDELRALNQERDGLQIKHRNPSQLMLQHHLDSASAQAEELGFDSVRKIIDGIREITDSERKRNSLS